MLSALLILPGAWIVSPLTAFAQSANTGTVSGNVVDSEGAIVLNATVTLTSVDQGSVTTAKVNGQGEYLFNHVKTGGYIVTVSAPTFQNFTTGKSVVVNATENVRIDAKLISGSATETVTVEAPSATVDTRSATLATVIDPALVQNLPVDGNNVVELAALLPGVTDVNAPTTFTSDTGGPTYVASGSRANQNLFLFDGAFWNNVYYNTGLNFPPPLMLQEVSVQLVNYKAQYGRNVGSVFNALTLSGTNSIHGKVWEYIQNKALNAADYISHLNPELVQNQFGGSVGGPLIKDKLFYYLGFQDLRSVTVVTSNTELPTLAERGLEPDGVTPLPCVSVQWAGKDCASFVNDFPAGMNLINGGLTNPFYTTQTYATQAQSQILSTAATAAGQTAPYNAKQCAADLTNLAGQPLPTMAGQLNPDFLPNAEIPYECFNPVAINVYNQFLPVPRVNGVPVAAATSIATTAKQPRNDYDGLARVDWTLPRHTIDARFYTTKVNDTTANSVSTNGTAVASYNLDFNFGGIYNGNIGDTWVISPSLLNVLRVAYKRYDYTILPQLPETFINLGSNFTDPGHPSLPILNASGRFSIGSSNSSYSYSVNADDEVDESLTWTRGKHNFQFGAQFLDLQYIHRYDQQPSISSYGGFTGLGISDFIVGLISSETVGNSTNIGAIDHAYYFYGQDDWRITPRLTLNLGLRYEFTPPWFQPDGQSVTFNPGYQSYKFLNTPPSLAFQGDPGVPSAIIKTNYTNFAPRVGFALDVFGSAKTVLRGGFGIFYDALNANTTGVGQPYHYTATYSYPEGSFSQPLLNMTPVPANYTDPAHAVFATPMSINFADPNVTQPYTEAVNIGFQQRIAQGLVEVNYIGKFGRHQIVPYDLNPDIYSCNPANSYFQENPLLYCGNATTQQNSDQARATYPDFNYGGQGIVDNNSVGSSNYNGLQTIYTQRSKMLTTVASYTYSRSLDDQSSGTTNTNALPLPPNVNTNYGPSDYQATHIFNIGWTLQFPRVSSGSRILQAAANGWNFGGIFSARTGHPFNVTTSGDWEFNAEPGQRPPLAPGLTHYQPLPANRHRSAKVAEWFNVCSFADDYQSNQGQGPCAYANVPPPYLDPVLPGFTNGVSRNFLYGPAFIATNFSLRRSISLPYRGMTLNLRADAFNVFNTPNLANPVSTITGSISGFQTSHEGAVLATVGTNGNAGTNGRRVQLAFVLQY